MISVSPLAIISGQETSISLKGRNLSTPGTTSVANFPFFICMLCYTSFWSVFPNICSKFCRIHCTGISNYTSVEVIGSPSHGMTYDKIKLSGFKVQNASLGVLGRCFIEVELFILYFCFLLL